MVDPEFGFAWTLKHTRRRGSIAVKVEAGQVRVLAPKGTAVHQAKALLQQRKSWITQALQRHPSSTPRLIDGMPLWVEGRSYRLTLDHDPRLKKPHVNLIGDRLQLSHPSDAHQPAELRQALLHWYQHRAEADWPARLQARASQLGLHPSGLKIRCYKSRWGSCTSRGLVSLNTLLAMAPLEVLNYVIVHELCHLRHLNHSPAYWALVKQHCPDAMDHRAWLRRHGAQLQL